MAPRSSDPRGRPAPRRLPWSPTLAGLMWLAALGAQAQDSTPVVVFVLPADTRPALLETLPDALQAQLASLPIQLQLESGVQPPGDAAGRFRQGRSLASSRAAVAVFWIQAPEGTDRFLYMMDPAEERMLLRPIEGQSEDAAAEALAIIARGSTQALLAGELESLQAQEVPEHPVRAPAPATPVPAPIPSQPVATPPAAIPPTPAEPRPQRRHQVRVAAAYAGNTFAEQVTWQSGVQLSGAWISAPGIYGGLGFTFFGAVQPEDPVQISVQRHPILAFGGYRLHSGPVDVDLELAVVTDILVRSTTGAPVDANAEPDSTRVSMGLMPRVRLEIPLLPALAVFLGAGFSYYFNIFEYIASDSTDRVVLAPRRVRAEIELGLAFLL